MDILFSRTLYMSCQAGTGIEPGPSALKASALPIELTWQTRFDIGGGGIFWWLFILLEPSLKRTVE